ncbi:MULTISPECIES: gp53-like domain-containing protein [Pseudomonas]|jgi:hypothetical protein|uniref:Putative tail fiber protein gp53-like C-terminal domain-containing protein n=1 Tax=Pseudomonas mosselii TaxID=78327 RepID=A0A5R8ZCW7_9PSED|nr:hypothetical protein [Pseudomonas mosselii]TLP63155.1 hypothetical protein FEM01_06620 [Pseudomonas mosselii]
MSRADNFAVDDKAVQDFVLKGEISEPEISAGAAQGSKWISLRRLRMGFAVKLAQNGYVTFPTWLGGLIIQWGRVAAPTADREYEVTFPIPFPVELFNLQVAYGYEQARQNDGIVAQISTTTLQGFMANRQDIGQVASVATAYINYLAIGR